MAHRFLTATWRNLIFVNYEVDPATLMPYVPLGLELDTFEGKALVSIVAFHFTDMKLFGAIPTVPVRNFEEINLRFYVRRNVEDQERRGVVFIKEVVPSRLIAATARTLYGEPYEARAMSRVDGEFDATDGGRLSYAVRVEKSDAQIAATTQGSLESLRSGSIESFILEHYWGYTAHEDGTTSEYEVRHEPWSYWRVSESSIVGNLAALYPAQFREALGKPPHSAFVARGSSVAVYAYNRLKPRCNISRVPSESVQGWVLYDGRCGFCSWWVPRLRSFLARAGFAIDSLQTQWVRETLALPESRLADDIRVLVRDGTLISGADAYIYCLKRIRYWRVVGFVLGLPGMRWITWKVYRVVNRSRFGISRVCRLPPEYEHRGDN